MVPAQRVPEQLAKVSPAYASDAVLVGWYGRTRNRARLAARSSASVMKPASRMRASTTWLRSSARGKLDHGDSAAGARASPAMNALSARVSDSAGLPNTRRAIGSTPYTPALR